MGIGLLILYGLVLILIFIFSLMQMNLVIHYRRFHRKNSDYETSSEKKDLIFKKSISFVTVQLPIYNEFYVAERLIEAVANLNYPKEHYEIQVLDDSTDETVKVIAEKVNELKSKGFHIYHIQRKKRTGFKAGALEYGLKTAKGEFIAIFDADFIPQADFLARTLSYFQDDRMAVVQTRWTYTNRNYSLLTKLQAFGLDAHFSIDQLGRNSQGNFLNFNGTAGIWRKKSIEDAGGWEHDTLTEDLDLSYRAQLRGWKFKYLENVLCPSELPVSMSGLKNQQFRWNKGGAENFRKLKARILHDSNIPFRTKLHAFFHLCSSSIFLCVFIMAVLSLPILYLKDNSPLYTSVYHMSYLFLICTLMLLIYYWNSYRVLKGNAFMRFLIFVKDFTLFLAMSMGLSFHNSVAVLEGHFGKRSFFVRTPKFNIQKEKDKWRGKKYSMSSISIKTYIEGLLALSFFFGILSAFYLKDFSLLPLHLLLCLGFGYVFFLSLKDFILTELKL